MTTTTKPRGMARVAHVLAEDIACLHRVAIDNIVAADESAAPPYADQTRYQRMLADHAIAIATQIGPDVRRMVERELAAAGVPSNITRWPQMPMHLKRPTQGDVVLSTGYRSLRKEG